MDTTDNHLSNISHLQGQLSSLYRCQTKCRVYPHLSHISHCPLSQANKRDRALNNTISAEQKQDSS